MTYVANVIINPRWWFTFKKSKPIKMTVANEQIFFATEPSLVIPFSDITKINYNYFLHAALRIHTRDGKVYKIIWSPEKSGPYSPLETQVVYDNLRRIINKYILWHSTI